MADSAHMQSHPEAAGPYRAALTPFLRAIHAWQWAMTGAMTGPAPMSLMPMIHTVDAAFEIGPAQEWAAMIRTVYINTEKMVSEARPTTDSGRREVEKWEGILFHLRKASECAQEHVAILQANVRRQPG